MFVLISAPDLATRVGAALSRTTVEQPVSADESATASPISVSTEDALIEWLQRTSQSGDRPSGAIVISDSLIDPVSADGLLHLSPLGRRLRELQRSHGCPRVASIAVVDGAPSRLAGVDVMLRPAEAAGGEILVAMSRMRRLLEWTQPPVVKQVLGKGRAVSIWLVESQEQLARCMSLRFDVYEELGYLAADPAASSARLEIDPYDSQSLHLIAACSPSDAPLGTVRLVVPSPGEPVAGRRILPRPAQAISAYDRWARALARENGYAIDHTEPFAAPTPVFHNFHRLWAHLDRSLSSRSLTEVSRLVVGPEHRGLGVSTMLVRAALALAIDLNRRTVLLECAPFHAAMYQRFGFARIGSDVADAYGLQQSAIAMGLEIEDSAVKWYSEVAAAMQLRSQFAPPISAQRFEGTLAKGSRSEHGIACLCDRQECWRSGLYELRNNPRCPLSGS